MTSLQDYVNIINCIIYSKMDYYAIDSVVKMTDNGHFLEVFFGYNAYAFINVLLDINYR